MPGGEPGDADDGRDGSLSEPVSLSDSLIADPCLQDGGAGGAALPADAANAGAGRAQDADAAEAEIRVLRAQVSALRARNAGAAGSRGPGPSSALPVAGTASHARGSASAHGPTAHGPTAHRHRGELSSQGSKGPAMSPAHERAEEIQRVLQEARAARAAAEQAKWIKEKLVEGSPPDWKSIVRHHLSANGDKVDEIRVAREAWMLERHHGSGGGAEAWGKLSKELVEMRQILASIANTLPLAGAPTLPTSLGLSFTSQSSAPSLAASLEFSTPSGGHNYPSSPNLPQAVVGKAPLLLSQSQMQHRAHDEAQDLVREAEEVYKKLFGRYPSRQSLVDFCAEALKININPFLPKQLPERSSLAQRSLSELNSVEMSPVAEGSQCWVCGSPVGKRGRCDRGSPSPNNLYLSRDESRSSSDIIPGEPFLSPQQKMPERPLQPVPLSLNPEAATHKPACKASTAPAAQSTAPGLDQARQATGSQKTWNKSEFTPPVSPVPSVPSSDGMKTEETETDTVAKSCAAHPLSAVPPALNSMERDTMTQQPALPILIHPSPSRTTWHQVCALRGWNEVGLRVMK